MLRQVSMRKILNAILMRLRFQLAFGLVIVAGVPFFLLQNYSLRYTGSRDNSILVAILSLVFCLYVFRRLTAYSSVLGSAFIIPTSSLIYGLGFTLLMLLRLDYSRFFLGMSYALNVLWFYTLYYFSVIAKRHAFALVPVGQAKTLALISKADWVVLSEAAGDPRQMDKPCDAVITDFSADMGDDWQRYLARCALLGIPVFDYRHVREMLTGKVRIAHISENTLGTLTPNIFYMKLKTIVDFLIAILVLIVLAPVLVIAALLIKLDSPGPVLFRQKRIGYHGLPFHCFKFRTMVEGKSSVGAEDDVLEAAKTKPNDPRITRLGRFLRKSRIDELPQIFNILKSEMSWIGPRPEVCVLSEWYEGELPFYSYRHVVKPGISGWAQVNQGHVVEVGDVHKKLQFDFYYIKNFSLWLDVSILFLTIKTIFTGSGAK
jgi:lipopolysaccharide/colanic/teichoic acid biosynthesis glycosyltransferase